MSITLLELRNQCRQRCDMEDSDFVADAELTAYINSSIAELHDILIQSYGAEYAVKMASATLTAGQSSYLLSTILADSDFYKLNGVDVQSGGDWISLDSFNFEDRNRTTFSSEELKYRLVGSSIIFTPAPDAIPARIWYTPVATKLILSTDSLDDINQYSEYIVADVCIKMLTKEESDPSVFIGQKTELRRRIEVAANNRDSNRSECIRDVYGMNTEWIL